jgi:hypothetical protein
MQGYGQQGGGVQPQPNYGAPPPPIKKKGTWFIIFGIIFLIIGILGTLVMVTEFLREVKTIDELKDDYDTTSGDFESYNEGDYVVVEGKITSEEDASLILENYYWYELDDSEFGFYSEDDIGNVGDTVTAKCKVITIKMMDTSVEYLEYSDDHSEASNIFHITVFIVGIILGIIFLLVGFKRRKKSIQSAYPPPTVSSPVYPPVQQSGSPPIQPPLEVEPIEEDETTFI